MGQLRDRMEQDLILKGFAPTTRRDYLLYCQKFATHPVERGEAEIRPYPLHLIKVEQVSCPNNSPTPSSSTATCRKADVIDTFA